MRDKRARLSIEGLDHEVTRAIQNLKQATPNIEWATEASKRIDALTQALGDLTALVHLLIDRQHLTVVDVPAHRELREKGGAERAGGAR